MTCSTGVTQPYIPKGVANLGALRRLLPYLPRMLIVLGAVVVLFTILDIIPRFSEQFSGPTPNEPTPAPSPVPSPVISGNVFKAEAVIDGPEHIFEMGFYSVSQSSTAVPEYIVVFDGKVLYAVDGNIDRAGNETVRLGSLELDTTYTVLIHVLNQGLGGANYYISGGSFGKLNAKWKLLWRTHYTTEANLKASESSPLSTNPFRGNATGEVDSLRPAALDLFDFPTEGLSLLSGRTPDTASGAAEWETPLGDDNWLLEEGAARSAESRSIAIVESNTADGLVSTHLDPFNNNGVIVRYTDPNNWIGIRRQTADGLLLVVRTMRGLTSEIDNAIMPSDPLNQANLDVFLDGDKIRININGAELLKVTEPFNQNATKHGLWSFGTTAGFTEFSVWPSNPGPARN